MTGDDTFFGSRGAGDDRTVLRPTPGGRPRPGGSPPQAPPPVAASAAGAASAPLPAADGSDVNALAGAAVPLLSLAARLRDTVDHPDPAALFNHVAQQINGFETAARASGAKPEATLTARYALCTLLDEVVLNTPWGSQSVWASQTLLNVFHNEGWGGEKFFQILERLLMQPAEHLDLLELMYLCMAMGLQGKHRIHADGKRRIDAIQTEVLKVIRLHRGPVVKELSPRWHGVQDARPTLARFVPLWVVGAAGAGVTAAVYAALLLVLNGASDPVAAQVAALGRETPPLVAPPADVAPRTVTLRSLLADEIRAGALEVREQNGAETVVLREGLFASGSGDVIASREPLIDAVGGALNQVRGRVLVTGHTDDVPIRTLRFPSNWQLSQRRAEAVRDILAGSMDPARLQAEGRADTEPLAPNDNAANRALNRRVEIALLPGPSWE